MGFGFLLYGYLMLLEVGKLVCESPRIGFDIFPDLLGYIFFFLAMRKLSPYALGFKQAKGMCYLLFPIGLATFTGQILAWMNVGMSFVPALLEYATLAGNLILLFFHLGYLSGIVRLSADVGLPRLAVKARIGLILSGIYYVFAVLLQLFEKLFPALTDKYAGEYAFIGLCFQLLFYTVFIFNLYLIFCAYRQICYEGEEIPDDSGNPLLRFQKYLSDKKRGRKD